MIKRFTKGEKYTLDLFEIIDGEFYTYSVDAVYRSRIKNVVEFSAYGDETYTVDLDTKFVVRTYYDYILTDNEWLPEYEPDIVEYFDYPTLTNIVKGWRCEHWTK